MSNITIGPPGTGSMPIASTIDPTQDYIPIYTASASATQAINRNTYLGLLSAPVGLADSQTMTNKTLTSPTISGPVLSGIITGTYTIGGTPTFPSSVVTLTGSQTLTNKVLTSPTINSPTITNATLSSDIITGFTTSNSGTIYGIAVTTGQITGSSTIASGALATNAVNAANLATNVITLGTAIDTGGFTTSSSTAVQYTGLTVTVTIPAGGRKVEIEVIMGNITNGTGVTTPIITIWDGTVGSGTQLAQSRAPTIPTVAYYTSCVAKCIVTPSAGSKTYNVGVSNTAATSTQFAAAIGAPNTLIVRVV